MAQMLPVTKWLAPKRQGSSIKVVWVLQEQQVVSRAMEKEGVSDLSQLPLLAVPKLIEHSSNSRHFCNKIISISSITTVRMLEAQTTRSILGSFQ